MRTRVWVTMAAIFVAAIAIWSAGTILEHQRRDESVQRLLAKVAQASDGSEIDLATAFDQEWDHAVVVGPYSPGWVANDALGFDRYPKDEVIIQGDGTYLLVFVRDRSVVAEVPLYGQAFYFEDSVQSFAPAAARFRVERHDGEILLKPPG